MSSFLSMGILILLGKYRLSESLRNHLLYYLTHYTGEPILDNGNISFGASHDLCSLSLKMTCFLTTGKTRSHSRVCGRDRRPHQVHQVHAHPRGRKATETERKAGAAGTAGRAWARRSVVGCLCGGNVAYEPSGLVCVTL